MPIMKATAFLAALLFATAALASHAMPSQQATALKGEVLETRDVEGYTYLRLATPSGETWAAVPTAKVKKGERVTVVNTAVMNNFQSKTLGKTFDSIVFGQLGSGATPAAAAPAEPRANPPVATAAAAPKPIKVAKAGGADARTVAEIYKGKAALKDKAVTLRAQVVKVNNGIMGKNWLHLQDGSGSAAAGDQDIVVTTQGSAAVGDVVTVKGTVRADVDVGMGYRYAVMIENGAFGK
jgi:hypothetical protein